MSRKRIVAISTSPLPVDGQITDGPGFRMWTVLCELARQHSVHILSLYESFHRGTPEPVPRTTAEGFQFESPSHRPSVVQRRISEIDPDFLYLPWQCCLFLKSPLSDVPTIVDYVGPGLLEEFVARGRIPSQYTRLFLDSFGYGDLLLTTTNRERYYLIGLLAASQRLALPGYNRSDPLVTVVRMTPSAPNPSARSVSVPSGESSITVVLAGAFLPWYDYSQLSDAIGLLDPKVAQRVRILVVGGNPRRPDIEREVRARLTGGNNSSCFSFIGTVPFNDRLTYYQSADVGLALGANTVEDELSARTRVVDYLGALLPIITPARDEYSSEIVAAGAGLRYDSAQDLSRLLTRIAGNPSEVAAARSQISNLLAGPFNSREAVRPILEFIDHPRVLPRTGSIERRVRHIGLLVRDVIASATRR